jgi:hypothetical protein
VRDERGAIVVSGVFMVSMVAAMLWFTMGIGDAAVHRERMQDAADGGSYASAVYHARGMNIVAMGNVVMAAEVAVDLSVDVSSILNRIELGVLIAKCLFSPSDCALIPRCVTLEGVLDALKQKLKSAILSQVRFLSLTQAKIAQMTPHLAQARALAAMMKEPRIDVGDVIALSMVPRGKRLGMPIQEEKETLLCDKAAKVIPVVAVKPLLVHQLPIYVAPFVIGVTFAVTATACDDGDTSGKTPKRIFAEARNGDEHFAVYAFGLHLSGKHERADRGVDLVAYGRAQAARAAAALGGRPPSLTGAGMAMAEFYYDELGSWRSYEDEALWNLKWRARMRRYREVPSEIRAMAPLGLAALLERWMDDVIH